MLISFQSTVCDYFSKLKEKAANATELQHQLDKMKQQHQEQQTLQQSTTAKLREAQVRELMLLEKKIILAVGTRGGSINFL